MAEGPSKSGGKFFMDEQDRPILPPKESNLNLAPTLEHGAGGVAAIVDSMVEESGMDPGDMPGKAPDVGEGVGKGKKGRPTGSKNKFTKDLQKAFLAAFGALGGYERIVEWVEATKEKDEKKRENLFNVRFPIFLSIIARMLPKPVTAEIKTDGKPQIVVISNVPRPPVALPAPEHPDIDGTAVVIDGPVDAVAVRVEPVPDNVIRAVVGEVLEDEDL